MKSQQISQRNSFEAAKEASEKGSWQYGFEGEALEICGYGKGLI